MRRIIAALALVAIAGKLWATPPGYPITGSAHDFTNFRGTNAGYTVGGVTVKAYNKCSTCHAAHRATRNYPLWGRQSPDTAGWIVWNAPDQDGLGGGGNTVSTLHKNADGTFMTGQLLDPLLEATDPSLVSASNPAGTDYLSATELVNTGTGLCMSCHDGQTAIGYDSTGKIAVTMDANFAGNWGRDLSNMHPVGKTVPFGTPGWQADVVSGNAYSGSSVVLEAKGSVGCTSCHTMHSGSQKSSMILRTGERCLSCHDR